MEPDYDRGHHVFAVLLVPDDSGESRNKGEQGTNQVGDGAFEDADSYQLVRKMHAMNNCDGEIDRSLKMQKPMIDEGALDILLQKSGV